MNLSFVRRLHVRHHWELVENATPGSYSRRCPQCGKYKIVANPAAKARGARGFDSRNEGAGGAWGGG
jgi:hypothetical protein